MNWNDEDDAHKDIDELTTFSTFKKSIRDHAPVSKEYEMPSQYKLCFPNCALMYNVLNIFSTEEYTVNLLKQILKLYIVSIID